jgi:hypothetical protein
MGHWANKNADEQARRIRLMYAAYGWHDPIDLVNDFEADLQQALRNHELAGRTGAVKVFAEEVSWMRVWAQELRLALRSPPFHSQGPEYALESEGTAPGTRTWSNVCCSRNLGAACVCVAPVHLRRFHPLDQQALMFDEDVDHLPHLYLHK